MSGPSDMQTKLDEIHNTMSEIRDYLLYLKLRDARENIQIQLNFISDCKESLVNDYECMRNKTELPIKVRSEKLIGIKRRIKEHEDKYNKLEREMKDFKMIQDCILRNSVSKVDVSK